MRRVLSFAALSLLAFSASASAQRSSTTSSSNSDMPVELGFDAGLGRQLSGGVNKVTAFQAPIQQIRAGFFLSPAVSIEPTFSLTTGSVSGPGGGSFTDYGIGAGMLWHLSQSRSANQMYVRPFLGFSGTSASGAASTSALSFGGGFGVKMPMANRFATRLEANLSQTQAHNGIPTQSALGLLFGLSVYTH
jgi:hypothetical protein